MNSEVRKALKEIAEKCGPCQTWAPRGARFRVSLPMDDVVFNHEIEVDIMWIDGDPVLHIIDRGTRHG